MDAKFCDVCCRKLLSGDLPVTLTSGDITINHCRRHTEIEIQLAIAKVKREASKILCDMCGFLFFPDDLTAYTVTLDPGNLVLDPADIEDSEDGAAANYEITLCETDGEKFQGLLHNTIVSQMSSKAIKDFNW